MNKESTTEATSSSLRKNARSPLLIASLLMTITACSGKDSALGDTFGETPVEEKPQGSESLTVPAPESSVDVDPQGPPSIKNLEEADSEPKHLAEEEEEEELSDPPNETEDVFALGANSDPLPACVVMADCDDGFICSLNNSDQPTCQPGSRPPLGPLGQSPPPSGLLEGSFRSSSHEGVAQ